MTEKIAAITIMRTQGRIYPSPRRLLSVAMGISSFQVDIDFATNIWFNICTQRYLGFSEVSDFFENEVN